MRKACTYLLWHAKSAVNGVNRQVLERGQSGVCAVFGRRNDVLRLSSLTAAAAARYLVRRLSWARRGGSLQGTARSPRLVGEMCRDRPPIVDLPTCPVLHQSSLSARLSCRCRFVESAASLTMSTRRSSTPRPYTELASDCLQANGL
jgi:hypothetical protein